ncbi:MAG: Gfo/Idh/MocA family protein, partial [Acidobacteriaceae bacterium]
MTSDFSRRRFLQTSAIAAGGLFISNADAMGLEQQTQSTSGTAVGASDRIRFGIIGVGMEGSALLGSALSLPGVECVAAADLYDGRHTLAKQITGNANLQTTRDYRELLDRKDIDCIIAAVPDFWHKQVVVDSCQAGKDIYCEKPMSHRVPEGFAMIEAAKKYNRILEIGSQRVSSALCAKAHEMYKSGAIGEVNMVELTLGRNSPTGAWEYPPPPDLSLANLAWDTWLKDTPKIPLNPDRFARWRCWRVYGTGVAGD